MNTPAEIQLPLADAAAPLTNQLSAQVPAKSTRLRKHADYQRVYRVTRKQFSTSMTWFLANRSASGSTSAPTELPRVGLTVGKVIGKAHERNRIKRRMREAVRHHLHELPHGVDLILHPRRSVMTIDFLKLEAEVLRIFRQVSAQTRSNQQAGPNLQPNLKSPAQPPLPATP